MITRKKRKLEQAPESPIKRQKEDKSQKVAIYEDLMIDQRQSIIIIPQYNVPLRHKKLLLLKAIVASEHKGKILNIAAHGIYTTKIENLSKNQLYIIHDTLITWHTQSHKKIARIDKFTGIIEQLKEVELKKYGQELDWFTLEWDEKKVTTNYDEENIYHLDTAGFVDSKPILKRDGLYNFWIKNQQNKKIEVNYWGKESPQIEQNHIYVFTCLTPKYYCGIKNLTINGPWYKVSWKWKFVEQTINASSTFSDIAKC